MRRKAPHAMTQGAPSHPPAGSPGPTMPPCRQRASSKAFPDLRKLRGRTSRLEPPASDPRQIRSACNGKQHHQPCRSSHGRKREGQTTGAIDTKVLESQSRGCSQALLYNEVRPHSSIGYLTPAEFVAKLKENDAAPVSATGRDAAVCGASAPRPVASPSREGHSEAQERPAI